MSAHRIKWVETTSALVAFAAGESVGVVGRIFELSVVASARVVGYGVRNGDTVERFGVADVEAAKSRAIELGNNAAR